MKERFHYRPSLAAFLLMMAMALTTTALSFFVTPVCESLGIGRGSFGIYYSIMTATGAFSTSFLGQYINRKGVRSPMLLSALCCCAGFFGFSVSKNLWMFYLSAGLLGFFGTNCVSLCANVIVQQSYTSSQASSLLGLVMSGSGVGGMIISLILPALLDTMGWRGSYRFLGIFWAVLVLGAVLLFGKQELNGGVGQRKTPIDGMTRAEALRSPKLYLLGFSSIILAAACGIQQQLPSLLDGMGFTAVQAGTMISFMTAMLAAGKILQGLLYSRVGVLRGSCVMFLLFAVSFLLLMEKQLIYPALVVLAFGLGILTTLMPTVARFAFGAREFAAIWSILATATSVGSLTATPVWGMVYDLCGSYTPALVVTPVLLVIALAATIYALKEKK